jgi:hypothetical protein
MVAPALLLACRQPTEIEFDVTTDVACSRVSSTAIAVGPLDADGGPFTARSTMCSGSSLGSLVVVPGSSGDATVRVVTGLDGMTPDACVQSNYSGGCIVARRSVSFTPHQKMTVPVLMEASCRDVPCASDTTCVGGVCAPIHGACTSASCQPPEPQPTHWLPMRSSDAEGVGGRWMFSALWTGTKLLVFGGGDAMNYLNDGGIYDPASDTWASIPPAPLVGRQAHVAVWTGTEMIIWGGHGGGLFGDGARFNLASGSWSMMMPAPFDGAARDGAAGVWSTTTHEMLVWGGDDNMGSYASGAAYSPATDQWRMLAASPLNARTYPLAVWLGDRMLVYGGEVGDFNGAYYDPKADSWSPTTPLQTSLHERVFAAAAWSGDALDPIAAWGGIDTGGGVYPDGFLLPSNNQFEYFSQVQVPQARSVSAGWMSNHRFWMWGGLDLTKQPLGDGAYYDVTAGGSSGGWTAMPTVGAPSPRGGHCAVWTGSVAIVWGGYDGSTYFNNGALFSP